MTYYWRELSVTISLLAPGLFATFSCIFVHFHVQSTTLDQIAGLVKKERLVEPQGGRGRTASVASWNKTKGIFRANTVPGRSSSFPQSKNIPKPQKDFMDIIDNSNNPFVPLLRNKPNAKRPLSDSEQT